MGVAELPEPDACAVCLTHPDTRAALDSCSHVFCVPCLSRWAKVETRCPLCKLRFTAMTPTDVRLDAQCGDRVEFRERNQGDRIAIEEVESDDSAERIFCDVCRAGHDEEVLLLCEACDVGAHTYCVGLECVPVGAWYCELCRDAGGMGTGRSRSRGETTSRARDILVRVNGGERAVRRRERQMDRERRESRARQRGEIRRRGGGGERAAMRSRGGGGDDERVRQIARVHELREAWSRLQSGQMEFPGNRSEQRVEIPRTTVPAAPSRLETTVDNGPKDVVDEAWGTLEKAIHIASGKLTKKRSAGKEAAIDIASTSAPKVRKRPGVCVRVDALSPGWSMTANAWKRPSEAERTAPPPATSRDHPSKSKTSPPLKISSPSKETKFAAAARVKDVLRPLYAAGRITRERYKDVARVAVERVIAADAATDTDTITKIVNACITIRN